MNSRSDVVKVHRRLLSLMVLILIATAYERASHADSALPLLADFDIDRVESVFPPVDETASGELAKLIYRLQKVDPNSLDQRVGGSATIRLGDGVHVEGVVQEIRSIGLPENLVEFLDMAELHQVSVKTDDRVTMLVTPSLKHRIKSGDRVEATGVVIEVADGNSHPLAVAAAKLRWTPRTDGDNSTGTQGWDMLSEAGLDISLVAELSSRNRRPLTGEDGDAFYAMLSAADEIGRAKQVPKAKLVAALEMLRNPEGFAGQWLRIDVETAQITRISVTNPERQGQLGSDHYFQIDAFGDLGNVVIRIEPNSSEAQPATFENRYPVSIVSRELPSFLTEAVRNQAGGDSIVANTRVRIGVDAFFFRLWSYSTDYMDGLSAGDQFGPLLVASRFVNLEPENPNPAAAIGWIASAAVILGVFAIWVWHHRTSAEDEKVRRKRQLREAKLMELPPP